MVGGRGPWKLIEGAADLEERDRAMTLFLPQGNLPSALIPPRRDTHMLLLECEIFIRNLFSQYLAQVSM